MPDREFRVLKTLGGCGGTIVSRSLAACGAVVLSEVNPRAAQLFAGALNPLVQVIRNYPELLPPRWLNIDPTTLGKPELFGRFISDISDSSDRRLVIRDYSYIDYIGTPFIWPAPEMPSLEAALQPFGTIRTVLLVRRPLAGLRSLLRHGPLATTLSVEEYLKGHIAFVENNPAVPIMRFEEFITDRDTWMTDLCVHLDVDYDPEWLKCLGSAPQLTGNEQATRSSDIFSIVTSGVEPEFSSLSLHALHDKLMRLCGYN